MLTDGSGTRDRADDVGAEQPRELRRVAVAGRSVPVRALLYALAAAVAGVWWLWPTLTGTDDDVDVLVVGDGMLAEARRSIELRVREAGLSIEWHAASGWCDEIASLASVVDDARPGRVVVTFTAGSACVEAAAAVAGGAARLVVVAGGGPDPAALEAAGFDIVDPTRLIGAPGGPGVLPCEWWEQPCAPEGMAVREADGSLTEAGGERLARVIVAAL